jgi:delta14-sterol reductase
VRAAHPHEEFEFEFGGPIGTLFVVISLPFVILGLFFVCNKDICLNLNFRDFSFSAFVAQLPQQWSDLFNVHAVTMFLGWMGLQVLLERLLPGEVAEGVVLPTGKRLPYTISGHLQFWISFAILLFAFPEFKHENGTVVLGGINSFPFHVIYDQYAQLAASAIAFSFLLSVFVYIKSFTRGALLAKGGDSGYLTYDFFMGR